MGRQWMSTDELPGLNRLMDVCQRLGLYLHVEPPGGRPPTAGSLIQGLPLDPVLATVYARVGKAAIATDVAGIILAQVDDSTNELESDNRWWGESGQRRLALPLFLFGGEPGMACYYATVPGVEDAEGRQSVVRVDTYEEPYALPVASNVDRFFETYAIYLEALVGHPDYREPGDTPLSFPLGVPELLARDARLVEWLRAGRFAPLMKDTDEVRQWAARVVDPRG
jgi:hypothetical protein